MAYLNSMNAVLTHLIDEIGMTASEAEGLLREFDIIPIANKDVTIGHVAKHGHEIHTVIYPEHRSKPSGRSVFRLFKSLLEKEKFLVTRVNIGNTEAESVTLRSGFVQTNQDHAFKYYWLDESTLPGARKCSTPKSI